MKRKYAIIGVSGVQTINVLKKGGGHGGGDPKIKNEIFK